MKIGMEIKEEKEIKTRKKEKPNKEKNIFLNLKKIN